MTSTKLLTLFAFLAVVANISEPVVAWGPEGHKAVARIGYSLLTPKAKATVDELLKGGNFTLDDASVWPDTIRKTIPRFSTSGEWHYVDAHDNPPEGRCIISALAKAAYVLADPKVLAKREVKKARPTFDKFGRPIPPLPEEQQQYAPEQQQSVYPEEPKKDEEPVAKEPETKQPAVVVGKQKKKCRPRRKHTATVVEPTQGLEPTNVADVVVPKKPGKPTQVAEPVPEVRPTQGSEPVPVQPQTPTQVAGESVPIDVQQPTQPCEQPTVIVPKPGDPQQPTQVVVDVPSKPTQVVDVEPKPETPKPVEPKPEEPKPAPVKTDIPAEPQPTDAFQGDQNQGPDQGESPITTVPADGQCTTTYYAGKPGKQTKTIIATTTCGGGNTDVVPTSAPTSVTPSSSAVPTGTVSSTTTAAQPTTTTTTTVTVSASQSTSVVVSTTTSAAATSTTTSAAATPTPNPNEPLPVINIAAKWEALSFLIHFSGDISQPEHTSGHLRGGNGFNVTVNGKKSNLHSAWDGAFIRETIAKDFGGKWEAWVEHLQKMTLTAEETANIACGAHLTGSDIAATEKCTLDWAQDTVKLVCGTVFKGIKDGDEVLGGEYYQRNLQVVNRQILKGGHRMAAVLNKLFG